MCRARRTDNGRCSSTAIRCSELNKRNHEGDYRCTEAEVRQMLRDASDKALDQQILEGFGLNDLDEESLAAYRNRFASRDPDHPFLALGNAEFLESIGAFRRDRRAGAEGLTLAGLLMLGRERSLLDALPYYHLDYQEQLSADPDARWTYRLTVDGKWAPNLFNFYYRVFPRLVDGLDVPFRLDSMGTRLEETHVHEALREALVNTLVHADHQSSRAISVIKRPDAFIFANPGACAFPESSFIRAASPMHATRTCRNCFSCWGWAKRRAPGSRRFCVPGTSSTGYSRW